MKEPNSGLRKLSTEPSCRSYNKQARLIWLFIIYSLNEYLSMNISYSIIFFLKTSRWIWFNYIEFWKKYLMKNYTRNIMNKSLQIGRAYTIHIEVDEEIGKIIHKLFRSIRLEQCNENKKVHKNCESFSQISLCYQKLLHKKKKK